METTPFDNDSLRHFYAFYRQYCETVYGLDENLGRVLTFLDESGLAGSTIVLYMGDNGFALGEHGFYDKRDAFEESIRVPMNGLGTGPHRTRNNGLEDGFEHRNGTHNSQPGRPEAAPSGEHRWQVFSTAPSGQERALA